MAINLSVPFDSASAAASPLPLDPPLRTDPQPRGVQPTNGRGWVVRGNVTREEMIQRLIDAGHTPDEAARIVDAELAGRGPLPRGLFDLYNTPEGNADLARRVERGRQASDRQARFEASYYGDTDAPDVPDSLPAGASFPTLPADMLPRTPDELRGMGLSPTTEPGPRMPDGSPVARPRTMNTERDARAYNVRTPDGHGMYSPSGRDADMAARGYVAVYNDDGTVSYQLSPEGGTDGVPGAPGRAGQRDDLTGVMLDETGAPVIGPTGEPVRKFETAVRPGPLSENNVVYTPTDTTRRTNEAYRSERQLYRMAAAANMTPEEFRKKHPELFRDMEVPMGPAPSAAGGLGVAADTRQKVRSGVGARMEVQAARQAEADKREAMWRAQMTLGGGRPTAAQKAAINGYMQLGDPSTNDWQKLVLAMRLGRDVQGITPIGAEAAHNAQLTKLGLEVAQGRGFQQMNPAQQAMMQQQMNAQKPVAERAQERVAAGTLNHPDVLEHANNIVTSHYSAPTVLGNTSRFTDNEVLLAAQKLADQTGMSFEDATKMMRGIQQERNNNATASTFFDWMYNQ